MSISNQNGKDTAAKITPRAIEMMTKSINQAMNLSVQLAKINLDGYSVFDVGDEVDDNFLNSIIVNKIAEYNNLDFNARYYIHLC
jgi:hypothetical protein